MAAFFRSGMEIGSALSASFGVWAAGAVLHKILLR
jgi:hypothetical protein